MSFSHLRNLYSYTVRHLLETSINLPQFHIELSQKYLIKNPAI